MIKIISPCNTQFGQPIISMVPWGRTGIYGNDRRRFEKKAAAGLLHDLSSIRDKVHPDETLVHLLAVGATEDYGPNRNGDGFKRAACRRFHDTFEKFARFYRNHANKDPAKSYGRVIKSAWNEDMHRIELLAALNREKTAALRNGGLIADLEMEKLAAGKEIPVSMACRVPYDECSYCGNKAPSTASYCVDTRSGGHCKAGGLRDNIGSVVEVDGGLHQLHAINDEPSFFDISHVPRQADRIAYILGTLEKAAQAHGGVVKSADLANALGLVVPTTILLHNENRPQVHRQLKLACELAAMEQQQDRYQAFTPAMQVTAQVPGDLPPLRLAREKWASTLRVLAEQQICLPLDRFLELSLQYPHEKAAELAAIVSPLLPGIYQRLTADDTFGEKLAGNPYTPADTVPGGEAAAWAYKLHSNFSLTKSAVHSRLTRAALRQIPAVTRSAVSTKYACDASRELATHYAMYQLAFLDNASARDHDLPLTCSLILAQNCAG